jgi:two-component sensor histidine kinase
MPARLLRIGRRPHRIRTYLVLFALALTAPLIVLAVFALNRMAAVEEAQIERSVYQTALELAADIDRELDRAFVTLETLATSSDLQSGNLAAFHAQARRALRDTKAAIVLIDLSYQQLVDTLKDYGEALPKTGDPKTAQRVIDTKTRQVSDLFRGSISGRPVFNVEIPIFNAQGDAHQVLILSFPAAHIADVLTKAQLGAPWIAGVTDRQGIILARSERHEDFVGKPLPPELLQQSRTAAGVFRATNVAGDQILRATARSELAGWLVSATVPVSHVDAPRQRRNLFAASLLGTALILGALLAYFFGRFMARPLDEATRVAAAVGQGQPVETKSSTLAEANILIDTLNDASAELKKREEHAIFLMRELAHRAKNQLAVVKGMALQTAKQTRSVEQFVEQFNRRIQGLAQSVDVLVRQNWQGARLSELVRAQLELFAVGDRAEISGPELLLHSTAVQNLGFALHELATNATKHGALSQPNGRIRVTWRGPAEGLIHFDWLERDGPAVAAPLHQGFGYRVMMKLVPQALQGSAQLHVSATGLNWHFEFPASHLLEVEALP